MSLMSRDKKKKGPTVFFFPLYAYRNFKLPWRRKYMISGNKKNKTL